MKSRITLLLLSLFAISAMYAQAPQGFQYQAVLRDGNGDPMLNTNVQFRFTVEHASGNPVYYQETQSTISNALGGINLVIGAGNGTQGNFETVNWKDGSLRVRVELDPTGGQNFAAFGITNLQSVPYALYADRAGVLVDGNGDDWSPEDDQDEQTLTVNGNQLSISNGNAVVLPTGSGGDNWGTQTVVTEPELTGNGTLGSPLSIAIQGASNGDVLTWNGNSWVPQEDSGEDYAAGDGISINSGVISNTGDDDNDPDNEIQTLSINGNSVSLSNGGGNINLPTYNEGTGIDINGNTISATNTQPIWNANQLQGRAVETQAPSNGQVLKWDSDDQAWGPAAAPSSPWVVSGNNIYYASGNVGFGIAAPLSRIHVYGTDKVQLDNQTIGKFGTISIEFSSHIIPETDDFRDLGLSNRRWDDIYATSGIVNTSDRKDKDNIQSIEYGLDEIMKLRPVSYTWKNRPDRGTKLGLIAQELETVIPEVVSNPERTPAAVSEPGAADDTRLGVYYSDLIPVLIKAIQEQEEKIQFLLTELERINDK